jgi:transposase
VREYQYVFGTVAPLTGEMDYMMAPDMKTGNMSKFLELVSKAHPNNYVIMIADGASSHKGQKLVIPKNMSIIILPPYSPELNPVERMWHLLRRRYFANHYFDTLTEAMNEARRGLEELKAAKDELIKLTCWPWLNKILNAI